MILSEQAIVDADLRLQGRHGDLMIESGEPGTGSSFYRASASLDRLGRKEIHKGCGTECQSAVMQAAMGN